MPWAHDNDEPQEQHKKIRKIEKMEEKTDDPMAHSVL
jgi:hypothetical protein